MIVAVPTVFWAVTNPLLLMVAMEGSDDDHVPPLVGPAVMVWLPCLQSDKLELIKLKAGVVVTAIDLLTVVGPQLFVTVYKILTLPVFSPVTTPELLTVAT